MATILGILVSLFSLIEAILSSRAKRQETRLETDILLQLRDYRKKLEKSLEARRKSRLEHGAASGDAGEPERLPDDGYRRD